MAETPKSVPELGQTEAAAQSAAKDVAAPQQPNNIQRFKEWSKQQATEYAKGIYERGKELALQETGLRPLSELFGPSSFSTLLKGTSDIYTDLTRARPKDDLQRVPSPERIPDLKLSFSRINTGLGAGVDSVLQRSQDEVVKAITQTYDVLKDRVYSTQKSITILDRNVRTVDVRTKKFEGQITSSVDKLTAQLEKLSRTQDRIGQQFQKIEPPERKDVTRAGEGDSDWSDRFVELWAGKKGLQWLAKTFGMTIAGLGGIGAAVATALLVKGDEPDWLKKRAQEKYKEQDKAAAAQQEIATQKLRDWMKTHPGQRPPRDMLSAAGFYNLDFWEDMKQWFFGARTGAALPTPGANPILGAAGALGTLFGPSSAQAAERNGGYGTAASQTARATTASSEVSVQDSILLKSSRDVSIKGSRITIEAGDIVFKGRVTGLPTGGGAGPGRETGQQGYAGVAETGFGVGTAPGFAPQAGQSFGVRVGPSAQPWTPGMAATTMGPPLYGNWGGPSAGQMGGLGRAGGPSAAVVMGATPSAATGGTMGFPPAMGRPPGGLIRGGAGGLARAGGPSAAARMTATPAAMTATAGGAAFRGAAAAARAGGTMAATPLAGAPQAAGPVDAGTYGGMPPFTPTPPTGELGEYLKQQISGQPTATMFGPKALGIPETPGYFGLTGNVVGALSSASTGLGGIFAGGGTAGVYAGTGGDGYAGGGGGGGPRTTAEAPPLPELTLDQQKAFEALQKGDVEITDPSVAFLKNLPADQLQRMGVEKITNEAGKEVLRSAPLSVERMTKEDIAAELKKTSGGTVQKNLKANQQEAYAAARAEGLSEKAARLLVGNMSGESLADPTNHHFDVKHMSQGIVQWDPSRAERIRKQFGKLPKDMTTAEQTRAAIWEMKNHYKGAYSALTNEQASDYERMYAVVKQFESPQGPEGQARKRLGLMEGLDVKEGITIPGGKEPTEQEISRGKIELARREEEARGMARREIVGTPPGAAPGPPSEAVPFTGEQKVGAVPGGKKRSLPLDQSVRDQLEYAAAQSGVGVEIVSGGQMSLAEAKRAGAVQKGKDWYLNGQIVRTGSTRHDHGNAADVKLYVVEDGKKRYLDWANKTDAQKMAEFTTASVRAGATGVGAGADYMGTQTVHVGGGTEATWGPGAAGKAPWLDAAVKQGRQEAKTFDIAEWKKGRQETQVAKAEAGEPEPGVTTGPVDLRRAAPTPGVKVAGGGETFAPEVTHAPALPASRQEGGDISIKPGESGYDVKPVTPAIPGGTPRLDEAAKGEHAAVPAMPPKPGGPEVTPATQVKVSESPATTARRAAGAYPGAQAPKTATQAQKAALLPKPGLTTQVTPPVSVKEKPLAPPAKPAAKAPDSVVRKKEPSNPQSGPDVHKGKEVATQPKENKQSRAENREPSAGDGGSGGGGGGTSADHCHFCDP